MAIIDGIRETSALFGFKGLVLVAKSRLLHKLVEVAVSVPGIPDPVHVRLRTSDVSVLSQVFLTEGYKLELLKQPRVIVDAGANIGLTSIYYASKYPDARIFAIEPESSNYAMLKTNTEPYAQITAVHAGLWKSNTALDVIDPCLGKFGFQTRDHCRMNDSCSAESVPGVTIDRLMADYGIGYIDILKIDIEGAEKEVFANATPWINKVGIIEIEIHDRLMPGCSGVVCAATADYDLKFQRGETVFFARREYCGEDQPIASAITGASHPVKTISMHKPPFRIVWASR